MNGSPGPRVLLAGFEPFADELVNPSGLAVQAVSGQGLLSVDLSAIVLPVTYADAWPALLRAIESDDPQIVLGVGLAGGRAALSIERVAINLIDANLADNAGEVRRDCPVTATAPLAYVASVPIQAMAAAAREAGTPAEISNSAGLYVCNQVFFNLCHYAATQAPRLSVGFVHVPRLPEQAALTPDCAGMPLAQIVQGLRACLLACLAGAQPR